MRKAIVVLLFTCAVCLSLSCFANSSRADSSLDLDNYNYPVSEPLAPYIDYLEDPEDALTLEQVTSPSYTERFIPNHKSFINLGTTPSSYWMRLSRVPNLLIKPNRILYFNISTLKAITVYWPVNDGGYQAMRGGWGALRQNQDEGFLSPVFSVPSSYDESRPVYLKAQTPHLFSFQLTLFSAEAYQKHMYYIMTLIITCLSILLAMILYNLTIALLLRRRQYTIYVIYILSQFGYQLALSGVVRLFSPSLGNTLFGYIVPLGLLAVISGIWFTKEFNFTRQNAPFLNRVLDGLILLALAGFIIFLSKAVLIANQIALILCILTIVTALATGARVYFKGYAPSLYFLVAWGALGIGTMVFSLRGIGGIPSNELTFHAVAISAALESILLALALAKRIQAITVEREKLQADKSRLSLESITDDLTGLYNSRHYHRILPQEVDNAHYLKNDLTLLVIDIDHFKKYNDLYGHQEGDVVLSRLGSCIIRSIRTDDWPCRYGGEEFAIIMPNTNISEGKMVAQRIAESFKSLVFTPQPELELHWTFSAGLAEIQSGDTASTLFKRADTALYCAKTEGRDRIEMAVNTE